MLSANKYFTVKSNKARVEFDLKRYLKSSATFSSTTRYSYTSLISSSALPDTKQLSLCTQQPDEVSNDSRKEVKEASRFEICDTKFISYLA